MTNTMPGESQHGLSNIAGKDIETDRQEDGSVSVATCVGCGCDDYHACWDENDEQPCSWLAVDRESRLGVCSACPDDLSRWEKGDREIAVPVEPRN
ncbi:MAG: hypothetical protein V3T17_06695 [Pseudomonadales bacterium]